MKIELTLFLLIILISFILYIIILEITLFFIIYCRNKYKLWKEIELLEEDLEKSELGYFDKRTLYQIRNGYEYIKKSMSFIFPYIVYDLIDDQSVLISRFSDNYNIINKRFKKLRK